jgi:hypothetical protein
MEIKVLPMAAVVVVQAAAHHTMDMPVVPLAARQGVRADKEAPERQVGQQVQQAHRVA